jgi:Ca2+/H+ antiporter, TMEM165/GDT1 family
MHYNRRRRFFWIPFFGLLILALLSGAVMWLWNHVLAEVIQVRSVSFWQAAGLLLLSRLLFGSWPGGKRGQWGGGGPPHWKARWQQMTDEEKARFKEKWRSRE